MPINIWNMMWKLRNHIILHSLDVTTLFNIRLFVYSYTVYHPIVIGSWGLTTNVYISWMPKVCVRGQKMMTFMPTAPKLLRFLIFAHSQKFMTKIYDIAWKLELITKFNEVKSFQVLEKQ